MRVSQSIEIEAPVAEVWETVIDYRRYPELIEGLTRWEPENQIRRGVGDRFRMLLRVGSAEIGGLVEVVEWKEGRDLAWSSVTGINQRGRWRLREAGDGKTKLEVRYAYGVVGGGIAAMISERIAAPQMRRYLRGALSAVKASCEGARPAQ